MTRRVVRDDNGTRRVVELSRAGNVKADWPACESCDGTGTSGPVLTDDEGNTYPLVPGCALDGHYGWHNTYRVVRELAEPMGYKVTPEDDAILTAYERQEDVTHDEASVGQCASEIADNVTNWLDEHTTRGYWQWDCGELFLRETCGRDEDEPCGLSDPDECGTHGWEA